MNPTVSRSLVLGIVCCAAVFSLTGCASEQRVAIPERSSFAPGAEPAETASQGRLSRRFPHGEVSAVWVKSGMKAVDEASAAYCAAAAEDFIRRADALDADLEEADEGNSAAEASSRRDADDSAENPRYTLRIKGGLSRSGGIIGRLWIAEEYLGGSRNNITIRTEMYSGENGIRLEAKDLFARPEALPEIFSRAARESLSSRGGQEDMYLPGTAPAAENFRHFLVTETGVMLYFEPCQVAAWAEGMVKVPVSIGELQAASPRPFWPRAGSDGRSAVKGK